MEPLPETQWSVHVAGSKEGLTPYREVNVFCIILSSSVTRAPNTKKRRTDCHHAFGQEWRDKIRVQDERT